MFPISGRIGVREQFIKDQVGYVMPGRTAGLNFCVVAADSVLLPVEQKPVVVAVFWFEVGGAKAFNSFGQCFFVIHTNHSLKGNRPAIKVLL